MGLARRFKRLGTQGHARLEVRSHRHHRHHRIGQLTLREGQLGRPGKERGCVHIRAHPQNQHIDRQIRRNLLRERARAADVILKERRRLVLITRETPLNLAHIRNMEMVTLMGGVIFPPVPAFYSGGKTVDDLVNHSVGRVLDLFDVEHNSIPRWAGVTGPADLKEKKK